MNIALIVERLVAAAGTAVSTPALTMTTYDYVPDSVETPCVYPESITTDFDQTMGRGTDKITVKLRLLCSRTDDRAGQHMLYGYLAGSGAGSIKAAIEAARGLPGVGALSGACDDLHVKGIAEARWYELAGERLVGADFTIEIWGDGA